MRSTIKSTLLVAPALGVGLAGLLVLASEGDGDRSARAESPVSYQPATMTRAALITGTIDPDGEARAEGPTDLTQWIMMGGLRSSEVTTLIHTLTATCMSDAGFEYLVPDTPPSAPIERSSLPAYRAEYGYGVHRPFPPIPDVNDQIQRALTTPELTEYVLALEGTTNREQDEGGGCMASAQQEAANQVPMLRVDADAVNSVLEPYVEPIRDSHMEYSGCMADAGYPGVIAPASIMSTAEQTRDFDEELRLAEADLACQATLVWPMWDHLEDELGWTLERLVDES